MTWSSIGAFLLALAVVIGAFGAHALRERLDEYSTGIYERAVFYQYIHALGLLVLGIALSAHLVTDGAAGIAAWCFVAGILIFCGSLYALALSGIKKLGAVTPLGGLAFIAAWIAFAIGLAAAHSV